MKEIKGTDGIYEYETKSGKKKFGVDYYLGKNKFTGNSVKARKKGFTDFRDALKFRDDAISDFKDGVYNATAKKHKLRQVYNIWWATYSKSGVSSSTLYNVNLLVTNHILKELGNMYIEDITIFDCQSFVNRLSKTMPKSFNSVIVYAKIIFDKAVKYNYIVKSPMDFIDKPRKPRKEENNNYYSIDEYLTFLDACKKHIRGKRGQKVYYFFLLLGNTGLRSGELRALTWTDVDFVNNTIHVNKTVKTNTDGKQIVGITKTANSTRYVRVQADIMEELKKWKVEQAERLFKSGFKDYDKLKQLVFSDTRNYVIDRTTIRLWNKQVCEDAGLRRITIHGFRHTFATMCFNAGLKIETVSKLLGHSSIKTTIDIYTHATVTEEDTQRLSAYRDAHKQERATNGATSYLRVL
ncbi:tyrosine-type recombinase/integrase [Lactobacillus johnsonii]|uniref:tyrosine-type recombinase/integrase n=1 Tax=Lactobacillus johnsonii TaxID=33959 RepID=UPI001CC0FE74|nr:site-specific integrase [Lactobacillus johnsonii]MBZ4026887.1 site-specific integrase [Lactobacillus johnsonii]